MDTYDLQVNCANCGFSGTTSIPKGVTVREQSCPNCATTNLERDFGSPVVTDYN